jgi:choloylglycine hydrolase
MMMNMKRAVLILVVALGSLLGVGPAFPCTTFVMQGDGRIYFGRNLDWNWENGLVIVNQRNIKKSAVVAPGTAGAQWTSKYGSVSFNQFGQEMPYGGMNEAGLVVENMWLDETKYPAPDSRPAINLLQWIQYQLDNCGTVAEVMATDGKIRLEAPPVSARIHYLVCDATGDCATLECLNGKLVCHHGGELPFHALANDTYAQSVAFAQAHPEPEPGLDKAKNEGSHARFCHAAARAAKFKPGTSAADVSYAFDTLDQVCQGDYTVWKIVYDLAGRQIHFRTRSNPQERTIDFKALDFSCGHPAQFADINAKPSATGAMEFKDLTEAGQRKYLQDFCAQPSLKRKFGDLTQQTEGQLQVLRTYKCVNP